MTALNLNACRLVLLVFCSSVLLSCVPLLLLLLMCMLLLQLACLLLLASFCAPFCAKFCRLLGFSKWLLLLLLLLLSAIARTTFISLKITETKLRTAATVVVSVAAYGLLVASALVCL